MKKKMRFTLVYCNDLLIAKNFESFFSHASNVATNQKRGLHVKAKILRDKWTKNRTNIVFECGQLCFMLGKHNVRKTN